MPADYNSTARALALPISPPRSPTQSYRPQVPWTRRSMSSSGPRPGGRQGVAGFRDRTINQAERLWRQLSKTVEKMTPVQLVLLTVVGIVTIVLAILFLVFSENIFKMLKPAADSWQKLKGGWLILWMMTFVTAFPPVIGYSTCLTLTGFVYGFPWGYVCLAMQCLSNLGLILPQLADCRHCYRRWIDLLIHGLKNGPLQIRRETGCQRSEVRSFISRPQARRYEAAGHDQTVSSALLLV